MHIISENVLMLFITFMIKTSPCLTKLRLAKVGLFFLDTVYITGALPSPVTNGKIVRS